MAQQPAPPPLTSDRALHQISGTDGAAFKSYATDPVWTTLSDPYPMTEGNTVQPLITGEAYFKELAAAIGKAQKTIYMAGWQINWDVHLVPGLRLYDALLAAAKAAPGLKIYVLPWAGNSHVPTYVTETTTVLNLINEALGAKLPEARRVFATGAEPHPNPSDGLDSFFSHHQKQVVIDDNVAFVGGIDVAYGRRDDASFGLSAIGRRGNDSYNGCLPHLRKVSVQDYLDPSRLNVPESRPGPKGGVIHSDVPKLARASLSAGKIQYPADGAEIDSATQPRMPWQDLQLKVEGPAVCDLAINFVLRWNSANKSPKLSLPPKPASAKGGCQVQMLRSASNTMVELEVKSGTLADRSRLHYKYGHNHIHNAMVNLINKADHFIYIENQFFVSAFGPERFGDGVANASKSKAIDEATGYGVEGWLTRRAWGNESAPPTNRINEALGTKLRNVIMNRDNPAPDGKTSRFHIYITLPVHSEGMLNDPSTMTQVHYTMQSLVFGSQSLINRTRRAILARKLWEGWDQTYERVFQDNNYEYESIPIEQCWPYITLLNPRNWAKLGDRYVTEQIYVHTKMMIVDDLYAIVGSANVNDRSLIGNRDSELAVQVVDTATSTEDIGAFAGPQLTRKFARELRMKLWNKLFCLSGASANVKPATALANAVKRPAAQDSWEAIREVAAKNTEGYDEAFAFIPRNQSGKDSLAASIWPTKFVGGKNAPGGLMPFDKSFWAGPQHTPAAKGLSEIQGFLTLLPWLWTKGENNNSGYHSALYVDNVPASGRPTNTEEPAKSIAQRDIRDSEETG
jgi:phospholipase D1/2